MTDVDPTRRAFLLAAGIGLGLGGVAMVGDDDGSPEVRYDVDTLGQVAALGQPRVTGQFPVAVDAAQVTRHRERAESLLSAAPERPEIPNEAVAREYRNRYEDAVDTLAGAADARTPAERLGGLRWARHRAADVNAMSDAFAGDLTREAVLGRRDPVRETRERLVGRWDYVGDDPTVAAAVHSHLESDVGHATRLLEQAAEENGRDGNRLLRIGASAGSIELARAVLADATYVHERFVSRLDEARSLKPAFNVAARTLVANVTERCPDWPDDDREARYDRDLRDTAARPLLRHAESTALGQCHRLPQVRDRDGVATAVLTAGMADRDLRALEAVRTAVRRGDYGRPRSAAAVRREKLAALEAVADASRTTPEVVAEAWTAEAVGGIERGDETLVRAVEAAPPRRRRVADAVAAYAWARQQASAVPDALARLRGVLGAAASTDEGGS